MTVADRAARSRDATWREGDPPRLDAPKGLRDWLRVARRGGGALAVLLAGVLLIVPLRLVERFVRGRRHPWTGPHVQWVCRLTLKAMGIGLARSGRPMRGPGAAVANHSSWLDILALNAAMPVVFVSKAEVAGWPGINILTRVTDTHFVSRDPRLAQAEAAALSARIGAGQRLLFFPEGTSSDGRRVLPFKSTLFEGLLDPRLPGGLAVQPVSVAYHAPPGADPRVYGWWGDMVLGPHLLAVLAMPRQGRIAVTLGEPVPVAGHSRKTLAAACAAAVRTGLDRPS